MDSPRFVVRATIGEVSGILCSRPYPRPDHCDPFTYATQQEAQEFADTLAARFPGNAYAVDVNAP